VRLVEFVVDEDNKEWINFYVREFKAGHKGRVTFIGGRHVANLQNPLFTIFVFLRCHEEYNKMPFGKAQVETTRRLQSYV